MKGTMRRIVGLLTRLSTGMKGRMKEREKGEMRIVTVLIASVVVVVVLVTALTIISPLAAPMLEGRGYVVFASGEYDTLNAKIDALKVSADAAEVNAEAAALAAQETLDVLKLHTENENFLFPAVTNVSVTLTAPAIANTWSAWAEIAGNDTVTLSSKLTNSGGYISQLTAYEYSVAEKLIIIEVAYDDDGTDIVGRAFVRSDWTYVLEFNSEPIPAGSTVYYRMMSNQANETIKVNFKYFYS